MDVSSGRRRLNIGAITCGFHVKGLYRARDSKGAFSRSRPRTKKESTASRNGRSCETFLSLHASHSTQWALVVLLNRRLGAHDMDIAIELVPTKPFAVPLVEL